MKFESRDIHVQTFPIALKFNRQLSSSAAEMPVKFQSDMIMTTSNLAASNFTGFSGKMSYRLVNRGPDASIVVILETLMELHFIT